MRSPWQRFLVWRRDGRGASPRPSRTVALPTSSPLVEGAARGARGPGEHCNLHETGIVTHDFGDGVYVGSDTVDWSTSPIEVTSPLHMNALTCGQGFMFRLDREGAFPPPLRRQAGAFTPPRVASRGSLGLCDFV